jgi:hypothetical protein
MIIREIVNRLKKAFEVRPLTRMEVVEAVHVRRLNVPLVVMREGIEE